MYNKIHSVEIFSSKTFKKIAITYQDSTITIYYRKVKEKTAFILFTFFTSPK